MPIATRITVIAAVLVGMTSIFAACGLGNEPPETGAAAANLHVGAVLVSGNPKCAELLPGSRQLEVEAKDLTVGETVTIHISPLLSISIYTDDGVHATWEATFSVAVAGAKGGPHMNVYTYPDPGGQEDIDIHPPETPSGNPAAIGHLLFCYIPRVVVSKDANPTFRRTFHWSITKQAAQTELMLPAGDTAQVSYTVEVEKSGFMDEFAASGTIDIVNPFEIAATISAVEDVIDPGIDVPVDCGVSLPYTLAAGGTLSCTYSIVLSDDSTRVNTAIVSTTGPVGGNIVEESVIFGGVTTEVDECVDVSDDHFGPLGTVCDEGEEFHYDLLIGPYDDPEDCGPQTFSNAAMFDTNDNGIIDTATETVNIEVICG